MVMDQFGTRARPNHLVGDLPGGSKIVSKQVIRCNQTLAIIVKTIGGIISGKCNGWIKIDHG